jgi:hypothetical protein
MDVKIPTDRPTWEGEIATYWFEDEILVSLSKSIKRTVELIAGNVELVKDISHSKPVPLLIYLKNSPVPDKETQKFSREMLPEIYTAMAMVSKPGLSRFIMNLLFSMSKPPIPMKSFTDAEKAKKWLKKVGG